VSFIENKTIRRPLFYTTENRSYLKNFEKTDADFDAVRFGFDVVVGGGVLVLIGVDDNVATELRLGSEPESTDEKNGKLEVGELVNACASGLIVFAARAALCARVAGMGGGKGIREDKDLSVSCEPEHCTDELEDDDDDGDGNVRFACATSADVSSSMALEATARSRSFLTSRTVR
jgi:hypothetical protein